MDGHAASLRGEVGGLQAGGGPGQGFRAQDFWARLPHLGPRQTVHYAFLFPFLLPPNFGGMGPCFVFIRKHSMPTLKRMSAIFRNGQVGTQLQAHSGASG